MAKQASERPNLSSGALFFGCSVILLLVGIIFAMDQGFTKPRLTFGSCKLKADVARTSEEKARGLSGRPNIPKDYAMIFPFKKEQPFFWMKDMVVPIDIVWVAGSKVVAIDASVPPDDGVVTYQAEVPIDWVIEVAAGRAKECGLEVGTTVKGLRS